MKFSLFLFALAAADADANIVLPPVSSGLDRLLIFIPGANVPNTNYVATCKAIQANTPGVRLTVVIPAVFQRKCIIQCTSTKTCFPLKSAVDSAVALANFSGDARATYLAGHSLGSTCANYFMQSYDFPYAALIVTGGYVDEDGVGGLIQYPVPVLTLGAELDGGLARPAKLALWYRQSKDLSKDKDGKKVIVLPSIDHSDFCPGFAVPGDLPSEVESSVALDSIGKAAGAFLTMHASIPERGQQISVDDAQAAAQTMAKFEETTGEIMDPLISALDMETNSPTVGLMTPGSSSKWCVAAQRTISGLPEEEAAKLDISDVYKSGAHEFEHTRTKYEVLSDGRLHINTSSHCSYDSDFQNVGERYAAKDIACKLTGADRIAQQLKVQTNESVTCSELNKLAVTVAEGMLSDRIRNRYQQKGRPWCFMDDKSITIGPLFVLSGMTLKDEGHCMSVQALSLKSLITSHIFPGVHYCKVLTPARAMDWMMTDSLQKAKSSIMVV